jgi:hypothetical protein
MHTFDSVKATQERENNLVMEVEIDDRNKHQKIK